MDLLPLLTVKYFLLLSVFADNFPLLSGWDFFIWVISPQDLGALTPRTKRVTSTILCYEYPLDENYVPKIKM